MACGILVPSPGIEPRPSAVKAQSPNHWTARELPTVGFRELTWGSREDCWEEAEVEAAGRHRRRVRV